MQFLAVYYPLVYARHYWPSKTHNKWFYGNQWTATKTGANRLWRFSQAALCKLTFGSSEPPQTQTPQYSCVPLYYEEIKFQVHIFLYNKKKLKKTWEMGRASTKIKGVFNLSSIDWRAREETKGPVPWQINQQRRKHKQDDEEKAQSLSMEES